MPFPASEMFIVYTSFGLVKIKASLFRLKIMYFFYKVKTAKNLKIEDFLCIATGVLYSVCCGDKIAHTQHIL